MRLAIFCAEAVDFIWMAHEMTFTCPSANTLSRNPRRADLLVSFSRILETCICVEEARYCTFDNVFLIWKVYQSSYHTSWIQSNVSISPICACAGRGRGIGSVGFRADKSSHMT